MTANQKKASAILADVMFSILVGIICAFSASALGASVLGSVSAGGGAFGLICGLGLVIIGMFHFADDQPAPPVSPQQGAPTR
ncbi:hypothetical protein ASD97_10230 [Streptomyces sp. Root63]|uniref:hypothetical protein n=1 Tax=unclassified Streptomyces TaxID=2593676 RepID=UPI0006F84493|nr:MULTISPECIES: hypothetical protein [unclassified Streptomyces]KQX36963.1 hypothetical protein ASD29_07000 [Streptomyces sp. Root1295]KRA43975.1 hypothetical protein ASD97_10230 [Streptomyces sp. Root63]